MNNLPRQKTLMKSLMMDIHQETFCGSRIQSIAYQTEENLIPWIF